MADINWVQSGMPTVIISVGASAEGRLAWRARPGHGELTPGAGSVQRIFSGLTKDPVAVEEIIAPAARF